MPAKPVFYEAPLVPNRFAPLPLGAIRPEGWMAQQLALCADGLTGHLHEFWPQIGDQCCWLGGCEGGGSFAPHYLDGLVPLAYLTDDQGLKGEAERRVAWILKSQKADGFFGPAKDPDWMPRATAQKALMQYYSATADPAVLLFLLRAFKYQATHLQEQPLTGYGAARVGEMVQVALWLYATTQKEFLLEHCQNLLAQGLDWTSFCHTMQLKRPMQKHITWHTLRHGMEQEQGDIHQPYTREHHHYHAVNIAMGLKTPALAHTLTGGIKHREAFDVGFERLMRYHGVAYGMFTGDTLLGGNAPTHGTELCAVAEMMYTLESLLFTLGGPHYADLLEQLAFNALPATLTADVRGHQFVQQANQVLVDRRARQWYNAGSGGNLYGLDASASCCTANMHQAYPKFVASMWAASSDGGLCAMSYAPCTVRYRLEDQPVRLTVESNYPFDGQVRIHVALREDLTFPMHLRIPDWASGANLRVGQEERFCTAGTYFTLQRQWHDGDIVHLSLPMNVNLSSWFHQSLSVQRGPLLFALRPEERFEKIKEHAFSPEWAVHPESPWNYALLPERGFTICYAPETVGPFKHGDQITIAAHGARLPEWDLKAGSADSPPITPAVDPETAEQIVLVPYGNTTLRISQFPQGQEAAQG